MASTSAVIGSYNHSTGVTTYAYGCYNYKTQHDVFVGRTQDWEVVWAYMYKHLTPEQLAEIDAGTGAYTDTLEFWVHAGH